MNRNELVREIGKLTDQPQWAVDLILEGFMEMTAKTLSCGEEVVLRNFGRFSVQHHRETNRPHPGTGVTMTVPAYDTAKFVPSPKLRERMNS